jgi:hypothetical protein
MKTIKIFYAIIAACFLVLGSCEQPDYTYTGPSVAEFAPRTTSSTYTSAFSVTIRQANYVTSLDTLEIALNLVGPHLDRDIILEYTLVTDTVKDFPSTTYIIPPTTGTEGVHFNFVPARTGGANGIVTIPAKSSVGFIKLNSLSAQTAPDVSKRVVIRLLSTSDLNVNPNFQYFIVTITRL